MDKKYYYIISAIVLLLLAIGSYFAFALSSTDYWIGKPLNASFNSSTNETQTFVFSYTNSTNVTADCQMFLNGVIAAQNSTAKTGVNSTVRSNQSFLEGKNEVYVTCINGTSVSSSTNEFIIDTTSPTYIYASTPTDNYNTTNASIRFTVSGIDNIGDYYNNGAVNFTLYANGANKTVFGYKNNTNVYFVETFPDGQYYWNITIRDNTTTALRSSTNNFRVDTTAPVLGQYTSINISGTSTTGGNMLARFNFSTTDAQLAMATAYLTIYYNYSGGIYNNVKNTTGTMVMNDTGLSIMHQIDLNGSEFSGDGLFVAEPHARDYLGNDAAGTNQTNFTKTSLYVGWNLIQVQQNYSFKNVSDMSSEISKVSWWNTSNQSYVTFTVGTATNADNAIKDGDAVYVYSKSNISLMRKWSMDMGNTRNISITTGWNTLTAFNSSIQLFQLCNKSVQFANATIKAVSFYDARTPIYYSQVCSFKTGFNNNVTVPRGKGYWLNINETTFFVNAR